MHKCKLLFIIIITLRSAFFYLTFSTFYFSIIYFFMWIEHLFWPFAVKTFEFLFVYDDSFHQINVEMLHPRLPHRINHRVLPNPISMSTNISDACSILDSRRMKSGPLQAFNECISFFLPVHIFPSVNLPRPLFLCLCLILQSLLVAEHSSRS